jgi:phytol kinase
MVNPWLGIGLVLVLLGVLLSGLALLQRVHSLHPELVRKMLHMGMGLATLTFPWLFQSAWPVLFLATVSIVAFVVLRMSRRLRARLGTVVGGVERFSLGEIYFPVAVAGLFVLYLHEEQTAPLLRPLLYCIPILLLTLADAAAALIGITYGRWHYATADGEKSAEGSFAFFICAFFCVHVPLLLFTDIGRSETLMIGLLLAWLATMFEAIAWRGLDNLALPLVSFLLLKIYLGLSASELGPRLLVTALLMTFLAFYGRRTTLVGSAVLGAFLAGYIAWALGGWRWLLAPLLLFISYTFLSPRTELNTRRIHNVHAVVSVTAAGLIWLFLAKIFDLPELLFPYTLAFAAHLAIIGIARLRFDYPKLSSLVLLSVCVGQAWVILFVPYLFTEGLNENALKCSLLSLPAIAVAATAFYYLQPGIEDCPTDTERWLRQAAHAALGSVLGFVSLYLV